MGDHLYVWDRHVATTPGGPSVSVRDGMADILPRGGALCLSYSTTIPLGEDLGGKAFPMWPAEELEGLHFKYTGADWWQWSEMERAMIQESGRDYNGMDVKPSAPGWQVTATMDDTATYLHSLPFEIRQNISTFVKSMLSTDASGLGYIPPLEWTVMFYSLAGHVRPGNDRAATAWSPPYNFAINTPCAWYASWSDNGEMASVAAPRNQTTWLLELLSRNDRTVFIQSSPTDSKYDVLRQSFTLATPSNGGRGFVVSVSETMCTNPSNEPTRIALASVPDNAAIVESMTKDASGLTLTVSPLSNNSRRRNLEHRVVRSVPSSPVVTLERTGKTKGMHFDVTTVVNVTVPSQQSHKCESLVLDHLPAGLFLDLYKARSRLRMRQDTFSVDSARDIDIELPQQLSTGAMVTVTSLLVRNLLEVGDADEGSGVTLMSETTSRMQIRYHPASTKESFTTVRLQAPWSVMIGCGDGASETVWTQARLNYSLLQDLEVAMPVGYLEDLRWVAVVTFGATTVTTLSLALTFIRQETS